MSDAALSDVGIDATPATSPDAPDAWTTVLDVGFDVQQPPDAFVVESCGNGEIDDGETCDEGISDGPDSCVTECDDGEPCTTDVIVGIACTRECRFTPRDAGTADFCCPLGASSDTDPDCVGFCGDGVVQTGERCDTSAVGPGACPTDCDDGIACTVDTLDGFDCLRTCSHASRLPGAADGCCLPGSSTATDPDCAGTCGTTVGPQERIESATTRVVLARNGDTYALVWSSGRDYAIYLQRFGPGAIAVGDRRVVADVVPAAGSRFSGVHIIPAGDGWALAYGRHVGASSAAYTLHFQLLELDGSARAPVVEITAHTPRTGTINAVELAHQGATGFAVASTDYRGGESVTCFQPLGLDGTEIGPLATWSTRLDSLDFGASPDGTFAILGYSSYTTTLRTVDANGAETTPPVTLTSQYLRPALVPDGTGWAALVTHYSSATHTTTQELLRGSRLDRVSVLSTVPTMNNAYWGQRSAAVAGAQVLATMPVERRSGADAYHLGWLRASLVGPVSTVVVPTEVDLAIVDETSVLGSTSALAVDDTGHAMVAWVDSRRADDEPYVRWVNYACP